MQRGSSRLAEMLATADPPAAVELLLRYIVECHQATGGAVLRANGSLRLRAVRSVDPHQLAAACVTVPDAPVLKPGYALFPLRHDVELVGLLYLEAPRLVEPAEVPPLLAALARALLHTTGIELPPRQDDRVLLRRVLDQEDWNIARAARTIGVTRRTVYLRMAKYGIRRRKAEGPSEGS